MADDSKETIISPDTETSGDGKGSPESPLTGRLAAERDVEDLQKAVRALGEAYAVVRSVMEKRCYHLDKAHDYINNAKWSLIAEINDILLRSRTPCRLSQYDIPLNKIDIAWLRNGRPY